MTPLTAWILIGCAAVAGAVVIHRTMVWSFSTARRHHLDAKAHAKAARHRAERRRLA